MNNGTNSLKKKSVSSLFWSFFSAILNSLLTLATSIILARLLEPEDFGLMAMVLVFTNFAVIFQEIGLGGAIIYRQDITQTDLSTVFYLNIVTGIFLCTTLFFASESMANFYNQQEIVVIAQLLSVNFVISSFGQIQRVLLNKSVEFKQLSLVNIFATLGSGAVGIVMAIYGFGINSLIVKSISGAVLATVLMWLVGRWMPSFIFSISSIKKLFGYSSKLFLGRLMNTFFKEVDNFIVGKIFLAEELGYYSRAKNLQNLPNKTLTNAVIKVMFPVMSKLQTSNEKLKEVYKKINLCLSYIIFPLMSFVVFFSSDTIILLLTEKWIRASQYLSLLAILGLITPLSQVNNNVFLTKGRPGLMIKIGTPLRVLSLVLMLSGVFYGISGMIVGLIISEIVGYIVRIKITGKMINYSLKENLKDLIPNFLLALVSVLITKYLISPMLIDLKVRMFTSFSVYVLIYLGISLILNNKAYHIFLGIVREKFSSFNLNRT